MPLNDDASISDIVGELNLVRAEFQSLRDWVNELRASNPANEQILAEMQTLAHNVTNQAISIENRITVREEKHAELEQAVIVLEASTPKDIKLEEGYLDSLLGVKIKASVSAQSRFTSLVAGLLNDEKLGKIDDNSIVYFYEYNDTPTGLPYIAFSELMSRYKDYCQYIESQY